MSTTRCVVVLIVVLAAASTFPGAEGCSSASPAAARVTTPQQPPRPAEAAGGGGPAPLFAEHCASCHGSDLAGGRAPSLFDEAWLASTTDDAITAAIRNGVPGTDMEPFAKVLDEQQTWRLIQYMRTQSGVLRTRPTFLANPAGVVLKTAKATVRIEVVADRLNTPWGIAFLPDGRMLVTERTEHGGALRIVENGVVSPPVKGTPRVHIQQDAGMFDVEVHPDYAQNGWIYLSYAELLPGYVSPPVQAQPGRGRGGPVSPSMTTIVRGRLSPNGEWIDQQFIFRAPPEMYTTDGSHFGSRFLFDRAGHLFYSIGDRGVMEHSQTLSNPMGKIHRVNDDGSVPPDNPFVNTPGAVPTIWSYGHRNPQGLAWHPVTGQLWESEHGPTAGDEINIVQPGLNYGWGVVTKGTQTGITKTSEPGMVDPVVYYTPTFAPAGISFYAGDRYPGWKNTSLFVGGLAGQALRRLEIDGEQVIEQEVIFNQFGRVRDVTEGPDGYLYLALQHATGAGTGYGLIAPSPGLVIRFVPVE